MVTRLLILLALSSPIFGQGKAFVKTTDGVRKLGNATVGPDSVTISAQATVDSSVFVTKTNLDSTKANRSLIGHTHAAGGYTLVAKLANDAATGANTTPISLTGLVFSFVANSTYRIHFYGSVSPAAATTGCGFQFDVSAAVTLISLSFRHQLANTGTLSGGSSIADDASAGVSSGMPANGGVYPVAGSGIIVTGANAGTAQLRFRSEVNAVTTAKAGLTLVVEKIQ